MSEPTAPVPRPLSADTCPHCDKPWEDHPEIRPEPGTRWAATPAAVRTLEGLYDRLLTPAVLGFSAETMRPPWEGARITVYRTTCHDEAGQSCASGFIGMTGTLHWWTEPPEGVFRAEES